MPHRTHRDNEPSYKWNPTEHTLEGLGDENLEFHLFVELDLRFSMFQNIIQILEPTCAL